MIIYTSIKLATNIVEFYESELDLKLSNLKNITCFINRIDRLLQCLKKLSNQDHPTFIERYENLVIILNIPLQKPTIKVFIHFWDSF